MENLSGVYVQWLHHEIIDTTDTTIPQILSTYKKCKILVEHSQFSDNFCANTTPHYHSLGLPKFYNEKALKEASLKRALDQGYQFESYGDKGLYMAKRKVYSVKTVNNYENVLKYLLKYRIIIHDEEMNFDDNLKSNIVVASEEYTKMKSLLFPKKIADETVRQFNLEFPTEMAWQKAHLTSIGPNKQKTFEYFKSLERARNKLILSDPLTDEEAEDLICNHEAFTNVLRLIMDKLTAHQNINMDNGTVLILCGPSGSFKSNICSIIGKATGTMVIMGGEDFVSKDMLKLDTAVKKGADVINIEEMPWRCAARRISVRDTLNNLKQMTTGNPIEVRVAKTSKQTDALLQVKLILITMNETADLNYKELNDIIELTPEYKRRMVLIHMNEVNYGLVPKKTNFKNDNLFVKFIKGLY